MQSTFAAYRGSKAFKACRLSPWIIRFSELSPRDLLGWAINGRKAPSGDGCKRILFHWSGVQAFGFLSQRCCICSKCSPRTAIKVIYKNNLIQVNRSCVPLQGINGKVVPLPVLCYAFQCQVLTSNRNRYTNSFLQVALGDNFDFIVFKPALTQNMTANLLRIIGVSNDRQTLFSSTTGHVKESAGSINARIFSFSFIF